MRQSGVATARRIAIRSGVLDNTILLATIDEVWPAEIV